MNVYTVKLLSFATIYDDGCQQIKWQPSKNKDWIDRIMQLEEVTVLFRENIVVQNISGLGVGAKLWY